MAYSAEISRSNPTCFVFLVDQSGSMGDQWPGSEGATKAKAVSDAINRLLQELVIKATKTEELPRDYFDICVIGYGVSVGPVLSGDLADQRFLRISELARSPARLEARDVKTPDGAGGLVIERVHFPIWLGPVSDGGTPMCQALAVANEAVSHWIDDHQSSYPPTIINITDGESTDGDPTSICDELKSRGTTDGGVLLFNIHLSSSRAPAILFPDDDASLPDEYARLLFRTSSVLPSHLVTAAASDGFRVSESSRGFVFQSDLVALVSFLDIGTRAANLR